MSEQSPFVYRRLTPEDAEPWAKLRLAGVRDFPLGFLVTAEEAAAMTPQEAREKLERGATRGVSLDGVLVGYCGFNRHTFQQTRHRVEVGPFFVTPQHHGGGAARAMMEGVVAEARAQGVEQLELFVDTENTRALAFYERQGFRRIATHPDGVRIDGRSRDDFFCIRRIEPVAPASS